MTGLWSRLEVHSRSCPLVLAPRRPRRSSLLDALINHWCHFESSNDLITTRWLIESPAAAAATTIRFIEYHDTRTDTAVWQVLSRSTRLGSRSDRLHRCLLSLQLLGLLLYLGSAATRRPSDLCIDLDRGLCDSLQLDDLLLVASDPHRSREPTLPLVLATPSSQCTHSIRIQEDDC